MYKTILVVFFLMSVSFESMAEAYQVKDVKFTSQGVELAGSIVTPTDQKIRAAVVFVHGSGKQPRSLPLAQMFAEQGIAALVYDKRGAGESGGEYEGQQSVSEKNIVLLADDAVAALQALSKHFEGTDVPLGLTGISQAGWIIPIAAEKTTVADFMLIWSGPVCKVSEEDIFSKYTADLDTKKVPSYAEALKARTRPYVWPDFLGKDSNPVDSLVNLKIPGLWIFGANDGSVPVDLSIERLEQLKASDYDYQYVLFSGIGHNNIGETFATAVDWILRIVK